ncbi:MAG TPA: NMD3-related protein [Candidatus Nanoarchaeia archaeon]|nr:NMD3-related protein [Candidatus Nanoarchaeia archaeon]
MPKYSRSKDYFEAILQIRPYNEAVINYVREQAIQENVSIPKVVNKKFGIDLYLSSKRFTFDMGKKLKQRFDGETKISTTLYGKNRMTSKELNRLTVLFRLK